MILLDPDLGPPFDPDPMPRRSAAERTSARSANRIPSVRALTRFLSDAQAALRLRGQVSVLLTSNEAIRKLNRQFRGKNTATDVLSFPAEALIRKELAGDLAISVPTALRQATAHDHPLGTELKVLILHGLLHLAGYDHETDTGEMAQRERRLRARLGLPVGLIERAGVPTLSPEIRRKGGKARTSIRRSRRSRS